MRLATQVPGLRPALCVALLLGGSLWCLGVLQLSQLFDSSRWTRDVAGLLILYTHMPVPAAHLLTSSTYLSHLPHPPTYLLYKCLRHISVTSPPALTCDHERPRVTHASICPRFKFGLSPAEASVMRSYLCPEVEDGEEVGWEEGIEVRTMLLQLLFLSHCNHIVVVAMMVTLPFIYVQTP